MTIIVADTTCSLPHDLIRSRGVTLIPQIVMFGDESYHDDRELDSAEFLRKLKAFSALPKTAAPEPPLYYPVFEQAQARNESVIVVAPSAKLSGTLRSAQTAAQDFPKVDIRVIDTQTVAGNLGSLVLMAAQWATQGLDADTIVQRLQQMIPRERTYFLVATLEYLQRGGRIGGAKALLGELLQVKPILSIREGQIEPVEQQRTKKHAVARLVEIVREQCPKSETANLCVMQAGVLAEAQDLAASLSSFGGGAEIPIYELPPAIVVHAGPGALAVGFFV